MRLTPLDIREQQFRRVMRGLDPEEVETFLATVASEFEALAAANNELRQRVLELEEKIAEYRSMEKALRDTLLTAEKVMGDAKEGAQREAALILREAELSAERLRGRVSHDVLRLQEELAELRRLKDAYLTRVRWLLRSHLELIDGHAQEFAEIDTTLGPSGSFGAERSRRQGAAPGTLPPPAPERIVPEPAPRAAEPRVLRPPATPAPIVAAPLGPAVEPRPAAPPPAAGRPAAPPLGSRPQQEGWPAPVEPSAEPPVGDLEDVLRPIGPDGSYDAGSENFRVGLRPVTAEEIAQAARRAERLAAEARAALERHAAGPPPGSEGGRPDESYRDGPGSRS